MKPNNCFLAAIAAAVVLPAVSEAAVIAGPTLTTDDRGYSVTGLSFQALDNSVLASVVFVNQGQADTVDLVSQTGIVLEAVNVPASDTAATVTFDRALTAGQTYFLLQTTDNNGVFAGPVPTQSDSDISITEQGIFQYSISDAIETGVGLPYYADFNDVTTQVSSVPEAPMWAMMLVGTGVVGAALRRRRPRPLAVAG
jgi:hypothetical protein